MHIHIYMYKVLLGKLDAVLCNRSPSVSQTLQFMR